jgi:methylenetetrahydrofolate reductase (NADPH)
MRIRDVYRRTQFGLSIEIFPPKTSAGDESLRQSLKRLSVFRPAFISCTYGAGGSTQHRTVEWCAEIQDTLGISATSHFTCVGSTVDELREWLRLAGDNGIRNIMALRGDPPQGQETFEAVEGGLQNANELVELIRSECPEMGIGVAGYPEKHQEAPDAATDLANLKRKVAAGADAVYTQLFYVNENFLRFREQCEQTGIEVPLIPGIMPITNFSRIQRIAAMCGAEVPDELSARLEAAQDDKEAQFEIGVEHAIQQCRQLMDEGVPGIHFYALNRSRACERILDALGFKRTQAECA